MFQELSGQSILSTGEVQVIDDPGPLVLSFKYFW